MKNVLLFLIPLTFVATSYCSSYECKFNNQDKKQEKLEYLFCPIIQEPVSRYKEDIAEIIWGEEMEHITPELKTPSPSPDNK